MEDSPAGNLYTQAALQNDLDIGCRVGLFADRSSAQAFFPNNIELGSGIGSGYINHNNGWAFATGGVAAALEEVRNLGAQVKHGCSAKAVEFDDRGRVTGVKLVSGEILSTDVVVIAAGSWTGAMFSAVVGESVLATGCVTNELRIVTVLGLNDLIYCVLIQTMHHHNPIITRTSTKIPELPRRPVLWFWFLCVSSMWANL